MPKSRQFKTGTTRILLTALSFIIITAALVVIFQRREAVVKGLLPQNGVLDISDVDFSKDVYAIVNEWDFYPEKLYSPNDFTSNPPQPADPSAKALYSTYRLVIRGEPNVCYMLWSYSVDYSTRVFVNGAEVLNVGKVADCAEEFVPQVDTMSLPLCGDENGEIEIIYQYANFVHKQGGFIQPTYLSTAENIKHWNEGNDLASLFFGGALLFMSFYFLLNSVVQMRISYLCLALCCLLMAFREQNFFVIHLLPPWRSWYIAYRFFILAVSMLPAAILLLLASLYTKSIKRLPTAVYGGAVAVCALLHFLLPTQELVSLCKAAYCLSLPYLLYLLYCVIRHYVRKKRLNSGDYLTLIGYGLLLFSLLFDALLTNYSVVSRYGVAPYGMMIFILLISVAISQQVHYRDMLLADSQHKNQLLKQMNAMNKDFLQKIAHELKTPLTVISGYAQLTGMQMKDNATNKDTPENLKTIQTEAQRLGDMVSNLMKCSYGQNSEAALGRVEAEALAKNVLAVCGPMCAKNNNQLIAQFSQCPAIYGNLELLLQICLNLIVNANKHTKNGEISLIMENDKKSPGFVRLSVCDTGTGILPENIPAIFEKGYSTDDGSGLGLVICKEAVETQGGEIYLEKTDSHGSVFVFTLPADK